MRRRCISSQGAQVGLFLLFEFVRLHKFTVQHVFHFAAEQVGKPARHSGAKVQASWAENCGDSTGHIFATVLANTFDDGDCAAVANREALADLAGDE